MHRPGKERFAALLCGAATVLCACAASEPARRPAVEPPPNLRARVYDCDGSEAVVEQLSGDQILLSLPSRRVRLPRVVSASGTKYAAGGTSFWSKGPIALLELPNESSAKCEEDRPRSLREDARVRGVHYRGLGNEPGWRIEIGPSEISLEYDYGQKQLVFPLQEPRIDGQGGRSYDQTSAAHRLRVVIEASACLDSMTGDPFDSRVVVTLDGRSFQGCGDVLR